MKLDFDYVVIGSGFGGSVMSCRLTEKGYNVCLLERGRQWKMHEFPRRPQEVQENMFWDPEDKKFGLMEFRDSPESDVMTLTASGLGGGSLIYANVLYRMPAEFFTGWPTAISRKTLDPYYDKVLSMMEAKPYPFATDSYYRDTPKTAAMKKAAEEMPVNPEATVRPEFHLPPLAIRFEGDYPGQQTANTHGATQSKCTKCGECDIGCNIHAKNTLDLNYIHRAKSLKSPSGHLEVKTQAEVIKIENIENHYKITLRVPQFPDQEVVLTAKKVILSAGSVGSTSLLLKMKKKGHLPKLNNWLGKKWCGNGDLLGMIIDTKEKLDPSKGPVITSAIQYSFQNYPDGFPHGMYLEDAGFPIGLAWYLSGKVPQIEGIMGAIKLVVRNLKNYFFKVLGIRTQEEINVGDEFAAALDKAEFARKALILLGMGRDRSDGVVSLREDDQAIIKWNKTGSNLHFDRVQEEMKKIAENVGGIFIDNPLTHLNKIIAVHPLGGCPMGETAETGLVNERGEVYGYEGLYVVDGSILPTSTGPNPSLTIAAVAEYIADQIPLKNEVRVTESMTS
ncbi:GMC oxidoreductase [Bdellovibrio svalbardensis]|uniref:Cholesterol oxidase n=1 Tax=Bdellovibrio svalbardensis TaxID=2972972 RepID=A0ABT6DK19_9BACT|nr:GMC family oxidoreductase [Bdellovibrio svalbardensis]MDG0816196.1 GMC family oxidoreductase [Bdellovibrio svalbardensis]